MKELLNNPWVVGALCIAAIMTVYLRLFDTKSSASVPSAIPEHIAAVLPVETQPVAAPVIVQPGESSGGTAPMVGKWMDKITRDPFGRLREGEGASSAEGRSPTGFVDDRERHSEHPRLSLRLHAIFVEGSNRIAVINNTFLKVGDKVEGFRVSQIKSDGVWLQGATDRQWLEFDQPSTQDQVS